MQTAPARQGVAQAREQSPGDFVSAPSDRSQEPLMTVRAAVILMRGT